MKTRLLLLTSLLVFFSNTPAQKKVDFAKKIADATPAALPQSPAEKRPSSDARDEGLKGKVKSVIEYTQNPGKLKREVYKESYYDESGNLIRTVNYADGYPESVAVWGYIDGMRVNRSGDVEYAKGEKPPPSRKEIIVSIEANTKDPNAPRDTRYLMRESPEIR